MDINLTWKRAIVCGERKSMGRAVAREVASLGASVTLIARRADVLEQVKSSLKGQGHHILAIDVSDTAALRDKITAHVKSAGPFHILVNNTGGPPAGPALAASIEDFEKAFRQH